MTHKVPVGDSVLHLELWDTAGQERYRSLAHMYYRGASLAVIVYDITKMDSFESLKRWVEELHEHASTDIMLALVGNKSDLVNDRAVPTELLQQYAQKCGEAGSCVIAGECSAKTGAGVSDLFGEICRKMIDLQPTHDGGA
eukprot:TRINITY_DN800_c0_g1_i2.p3 TRINITY_DN800_c0_g1~~TRINITY_DN800_c0_g1_i2.p3  ORF type:complete len:141 (+),score=36.60 TRINITY_DN800_c0_g1_i2:367-789(+)